MKKIIILVFAVFGILLFNIKPVHAIEVSINDYSIKDYYTLGNNNNIITQSFSGGDHLIGSKMFYLDSVDVHNIQFELNVDSSYLSAFKYIYFAYNSYNDPFDTDYDVLYINISGDIFGSSYDSVTEVRYWGSEYTVSGFSPNDVLYDDEMFLGSLFTVGEYTSKIYVSFIVQSIETINDVQNYLLNYLARQIYITNRTAQNILNSSFDSIQAYEDGFDDGYDKGFSDGYGTSYDDGYDDGKRDYGYYSGTNWITANVYGFNRYNVGLEENRDLYGIFHNGNWLTAEQWGDIRYNAGYDSGLSNEIDWWSWSMTFFLMPFRVLNIQILPGVRIGYFALFSLLLGVVGWFFFIVGKGGGRRK